MHSILIRLLGCFVGILWAQNVGIGTSTPTERLHVAGNLRLDNAFMPGNQPGAVGNLLLSQGPGVAPIWLANGAIGSILMIGPGGTPVWATNPICTTPTLNRLIKFTSTTPTAVCNTTLIEEAAAPNRIWNADGAAAPFATDKFSIYALPAARWAISGYSTIDNGGGVYGSASGANGYGVYGASSRDNGIGVVGINTHAAGVAGYFENIAAAGTAGGDGVIGFTHQSAANGVWGVTDHAQGIGGVWATNIAPAGTNTGIGAGVLSRQRGGSALVVNMRNDALLSLNYYANAVITAYHMGGTSAANDPPVGIIAQVNSGDNNARAIWGFHTSGPTNVNAYAVVGEMQRGAASTGQAIGVLGINPRNGVGDWAVYGNGWLGAPNKAFIIDHPLDPENKYLLHFTVEGPEAYNLYRGVVVTDAQGRAEVQLPDYFEAATKDPQYILTPIGTFAQTIVEQEISNNKFVIRTDKPHVKVSWVVIATRDDPYMRYFWKPTVIEKEASQKGKYLVPQVYGKGTEYGIFSTPASAIEVKRENQIPPLSSTVLQRQELRK
ncbi:MAG: hypothetical protein RMJ66_03725 [Bacteroidia bacterium]|nr:hypothetical protein [Bacteroidia bacterium]MDW8134156.1 hypothetical protein [Bacteroidia bacterium]